VDIPGNFALLNNATMYDGWADARRRYERKVEGTRAADCIACRECEELCPQDILISEWMPVVHQVLGLGQSLDACHLP